MADAQLTLNEFHIRRISDAQGPLVRQMSDGIARVVENEISGAALTAKLNRAIEKKRDRLVFAPAELLKSQWWPSAKAISPGESP